VPPSRPLHIDESLSKRLAKMLRERGRNAQSASEMGLLELKDEPALRAVYESGDDVVFVTADDSLPSDHAGVVREVRATIATIRPFELSRGWASPYQQGISEEEAWKRETVQRWAHVIADQERGTKRRYSPSGYTTWTPKIRKQR
jgi:hypothetical protein